MQVLHGNANSEVVAYIKDVLAYIQDLVVSSACFITVIILQIIF